MKLNFVGCRLLATVAILALFSGMVQAQFRTDGLDSKVRSVSRKIVAQPTQIYGPQAVATINQNIVTGADSGAAPEVKRFDTPALTVTADFFAFAPAFTGGVRVAVGDVNGDGVGDIITGAGPGGGPQVSVFDGVNGSLIRSFFAYNAGFTGGIFVASGDVNGDGRADIVTGTDAAAGIPTEVKVFDSTSLAVLKDFFPFSTFAGGGRVAAAKVNSDGIADIIVGAGPGGGPEVKVFDGVSGAAIKDFFAYTASFTGGVFVAAGDVNNDLSADIMTSAGPGGGSEVKTFSGATGAQIGSVFAPTFIGGTRVAVGRVNADAIPDILVSPGPGSPPQVEAFDGATNALIHNFFAYDVTFTGGVFVAAPPVAVPSAASVAVSGRVMTPDGRGLRNAYVFLNDPQGVSRRVLTSSFGYYRFDDVQVGETYVIGVSSKLYRFAPRLLNVSDELTGIDLIGQE